MDLLARVDGAMTTAMRARDRVTLAPLRMLKTALVNRRVELGRALDDLEAQGVAASPSYGWLGAVGRLPAELPPAPLPG